MELYLYSPLYTFFTRTRKTIIFCKLHVYVGNYVIFNFLFLATLRLTQKRLVGTAIVVSANKNCKFVNINYYGEFLFTQTFRANCITNLV
jgi:hypothetical protein